MPAMVTISCRTRAASRPAQPHPPGSSAHLPTTVLRLGSGHEGRTSPCQSRLGDPINTASTGHTFAIGNPVTVLEPGRALVMGTWAFVLQPLPGDRTRLLVRDRDWGYLRAAAPRRLALLRAALGVIDYLIGEPLHFAMERK
jgi:hypothetical protein